MMTPSLFENIIKYYHYKLNPASMQSWATSDPQAKRHWNCVFLVDE